MAPRPTYAPPHVQLRRLGQIAREEGLSFEEFWQRAVRPGDAVVMANDLEVPAGAVRWPTDYHDRTAWRAAIAGSREGWRRAYEQLEPVRAERALAYLADSIGAFAAAVEEIGDEPIELAAAA